MDGLGQVECAFHQHRLQQSCCKVLCSNTSYQRKGWSLSIHTAGCWETPWSKQPSTRVERGSGGWNGKEMGQVDEDRGRFGSCGAMQNCIVWTCASNIASAGPSGFIVVPGAYPRAREYSPYFETSNS